MCPPASLILPRGPLTHACKKLSGGCGVYTRNITATRQTVHGMCCERRTEYHNPANNEQGFRRGRGLQPMVHYSPPLPYASGKHSCNPARSAQFRPSLARARMTSACIGSPPQEVLWQDEGRGARRAAAPPPSSRGARWGGPAAMAPCRHVKGRGVPSSGGAGASRGKLPIFKHSGCARRSQGTNTWRYHGVRDWDVARTQAREHSGVRSMLPQGRVPRTWPGKQAWHLRGYDGSNGLLAPRGRKT